jgi:hypothetical protein
MNSCTPVRFLILCSVLTFTCFCNAQVFVVGEKTATADVTTEFHPTHIEVPRAALTERGRLDLIRNLEAEQGFAHRELPFGPGLTLIANGNMTPAGEDYKRLLYLRGQSAVPGDRVAITALAFKADTLVIDFNGGPYAKHRFLSHLSFNGMQVAREGPIATGFRISLVFEGGLPEVTAPEVKALLDPLVDFRAKSSDEAYTDSLSPKVRTAVSAHEILVGMDRRMVLASVGAPRDKHREHTIQGDNDSPMYEEWIYGQPPEAARFVRFQEGRVVRLEIAALGKPIEIHDHNELGVEAAPTLEARAVINGDVQPEDQQTRNGKPPTLRRPGESSDAPNSVGRVNLPADAPPATTTNKQMASAGPGN